MIPLKPNHAGPHPAAPAAGLDRAALAFGLIVLGGVVRITGSGMGCGDHWPRCDGEWFPPLDLPTMIEIGHRWAAALVSLLVLARGGWWPGVRHRDEPRFGTPATLASFCWWCRSCWARSRSSWRSRPG